MKINYKQLMSLKKQMYDNNKTLIDNISDSKKIIDKLDNRDIWQGEGYEDFQNKVSSFHTNFKAYCNQLYELINIIENVVQKYEEIDKKVQQTVGTFSL